MLEEGVESIGLLLVEGGDGKGYVARGGGIPDRGERAHATFEFVGKGNELFAATSGAIHYHQIVRLVGGEAAEPKQLG